MGPLRNIIVLSVLVVADIPVHCLRGDISGKWKLHLGEPVSPGHKSAEVPDFSSGGIAENFCFSGHPNRNEDNIHLDLGRNVQNPSIVELELTLDVAVNPDHTEHMVAKTNYLANGANHLWTTAYDEGWEVRVRSQDAQANFFALSHYTCAEDNLSCGQNGVGENAHGQTKGYKSQCGKVLVGWYTVTSSSGTSKGCFFGEKEHEPEKVHSFVMEEMKEQGPEEMTRVRTAYHHSDFADDGQFVFPSVLQLHEAGDIQRGFTTINRPGGIKMANRQGAAMMRVRDECEGNDISEHPFISQMEAAHPTWDWREYAQSEWDTDIQDQGSCGSCYAIAAIYVLQARTNILLHKRAKQAGKPFPGPIDLSAHSVLACSYYNQGCEGGYPYLVGKHAVEFGVPQESCQPYGSAGMGRVEQCNAECFRSEESVVFAKDYNYVGGFYGVCGEARLMQSLYEHGPVVVAIEVPTPFQSAGADKLVGDSYLAGGSYLKRKQNLRLAAVGQRGEIHLSEAEPHFPAEHSREDPSPNSKYLEVRWHLKAHGAKCESYRRLTNEQLSAALSDALPAGSYRPGETQRFSIDTDQYPMNAEGPYEASRSALAKALNVDESCVVLQMADGTTNGWEYTNHAVVVVGWGQKSVQTSDGEEIHKYWIVRNSWGSLFGDRGYAYVARGINYAGIESQAVHLIPDETRGYIKAALDDIGK
jgi:cathepsin C